MTLKNKKISKYLKIIDQIENARTKNNFNWMEILRLGIKSSPDEAIKILKKINTSDEKISKLLKKII